MSGFDWKLPSDVQEEKDKEQGEYLAAINNPKHPKHEWAKGVHAGRVEKDKAFWNKLKQKNAKRKQEMAQRMYKPMNDEQLSHQDAILDPKLKQKLRDDVDKLKGIDKKNIFKRP